MKTNKVIHGDSLEYMKSLPNKCIDLIITDPPYFGIVNNDWDNQWETRDEFINWLEQFTREWKRILKDNGSLYIFGDDKIIAYIQVMMDKYFKLENNIVWHKPNNLPIKGWAQFNSYAPATERLLFYSNEIVNINGICVNNARAYIREEVIRANKKIVLKDINIALGTASNGGGVASACLSLDKTEPVMITEEHYLKLREWLNGGKEYNYLRKEYNDLKKEYNYLRKEYNDLRRYFKPVNNFMDVWTFPLTTEKEKWAGKHPTIKPLAIIKRIIETSSRKGAIILDCFAGSFTTAIACIETGRNYICIEKEAKYVEIGNKRIKNTTPPLFVI